jgi:hypothetical protein
MLKIRVFGTHTSTGLTRASPMSALAARCRHPIADLDQIAHLEIRRHHRLGGILNEYNMQLDLHG